MKMTAHALVLAGGLILMSTGSVYATDQTDAIAHDLRHELSSTYTGLTLSVSDDGVATVAGNVNSAIDRNRIEKRLLKDSRVNKVINLITAN